MDIFTCTLPAMPRKKLAENEKRTALTARVLPSLVDALQAIADADDRTLSYMVERAVREYVEKHAPPKPRDRK